MIKRDGYGGGWLDGRTDFTKSQKEYLTMKNLDVIWLQQTCCGKERFRVIQKGMRSDNK